MSKSRAFIGKFVIEQVDDDDTYTISMVQLSDDEKGMLAEIVRCRDCKQFHLDNTEHEYRDPYWCDRWRNDRVDPEGFCAWGKRKNKLRIKEES